MKAFRFSILIPALTIILTGCFLTDWWNVLTDDADRLPTQALTVVAQDGELRLVVEVADEEHERARGLMGRKKVGNGQGMWFIFEDEGVQRFWMWNMEMSIDIIYVNKDLKIRGILENVPACGFGEEDGTENQLRCPSYPSSEAVQYVLEVEAGFAEKYGVKLDDEIVLE